MARTVLFVEVPNYYAMVERCRDASLARRPVIVGGDPRKRGLVQAATPDALDVGVRPNMPVSEAMGLCPRARMLRTDMIRYREVSRRLFATLRRCIRRLEPFGLGAAYFDVSGREEPPSQLISQLTDRVKIDLGLPLRAGVASGKFLARLAAEEAGDEGLRVVISGEEEQFLGPLDYTRLDGVGRKTAGRLAELGAQTIADVVQLGSERLELEFGVHGLRISALASGIDDAPIRAASHPKSVSREATIGSSPSQKRAAASAEGSTDLTLLTETLQQITRALDGELQMQGLAAGRLTLKVRFGDQGRTTRSETFGSPTSDPARILDCATRLLTRTQAGSRQVRGLGIQLGCLALREEADRQLDLFPPQH